MEKRTRCCLHVLVPRIAFAASVAVGVASLGGCRQSRVEVRAPAAQTSNASAVAAPSGNMPPVASAQVASTKQGTPLQLRIQANSAGGGDLTIVIVSPPAHGELGALDNSPAETASLTYTPQAGFTGTDSFTFAAVDSHGERSPPATVNIEVRP